MFPLRTRSEGASPAKTPALLQTLVQQNGKGHPAPAQADAHAGVNATVTLVAARRQLLKDCAPVPVVAMAM